MDTVSLWLSSVAIIIAVLSLLFSVLSWRESNRPIVTARVTTAAGDLAGYGTGAALNLLVENTGNRPARNIKLSVIEKTLRAAFDPAISDVDREDIQACFSTKFVIPVLANNQSTSNAFGFLGHDSNNTWKLHSRFPVTISYEDLDGRCFRHTLHLLVADNAGFASSHWK
jgi:hypothetical protein